MRVAAGHLQFTPVPMRLSHPAIYIRTTIMTMIARILDERAEASSTCFLAQITLEDYVAALPATYKAYDVQREIVTNVYLDHLVNTVLEKRHIPPIVLVVDSNKFVRDERELKIETFKILDGLQRTFRLRSIRETIKFAIKPRPESLEECLSWSRFKFSRHFSSDLREIESNTDVLRAVLESLQKVGLDRLLETYTNNVQWFEIWTGLSPDEEVRKMLTLNAGHKPVKARHQLELLFLNLLPLLREGEGDVFQLVREKEVGATQFSKGRQCGSFHFAHIITALLSLYEGKPVAATTELIQGIQSRESSVDEYAEYMKPDFLRHFVAFLVQIDQVLTKEYKEIGTRWIGREVSLAGMLGGIGAVSIERKIPRETVMDELLDVLTEYPKALNLGQFETVRNSVELSKVNIGSINRNAVFGATQSLLSDPGNVIDWQIFFGTNAQ